MQHQLHARRAMSSTIPIVLAVTRRICPSMTQWHELTKRCAVMVARLPTPESPLMRSLIVLSLLGAPASLAAQSAKDSADVRTAASVQISVPDSAIARPVIIRADTAWVSVRASPIEIEGHRLERRRDRRWYLANCQPEVIGIREE